MKKIIVITISLLLAAVFARFLFYKYDGWKTAQKLKAGRVPGVTVEEVQARNVIKKFEAPGRIQSKERIDVVTRVSGYLVHKYFKEGDIVKKGQVLYQIEPQEYQLAVNKAKANLENSKSQLNYYEKQLIRAEELVKKDYIAKSQYDQTLAQRDSYKAQVALNESAYQDALRNLSYTKIVSPVDGQVGISIYTEGNYVTPASGALTTINSIDPVYVLFPIDAKNYTELLRVDKVANVNREVDLYFSTGEKYEYKGIQDFHDNSIDPSTGAISMRATFPNPKGLLINGNYTTVYIYSKEKDNVPVVPQIAVMENPQYKYVYVIDKNGLAQVQKIETFGQDGKDWIVKSGLKPGDKIVVTGIQSVIPGNKVRILSEKEIEELNKKAEEVAKEKQAKDHTADKK